MMYIACFYQTYVVPKSIPIAPSYSADISNRLAKEEKKRERASTTDLFHIVIVEKNFVSRSKKVTDRNPASHKMLKCVSGSFDWFAQPQEMV